MLLIDLDGFRAVSSTLGHQNGDLVIQEVGARLGDVVGEADRVARVRVATSSRWSCPTRTRRWPRQVAGKVLKALEQPIMVERLPIEMGASIGIAVAPVHGLEPEIILRKGRPGFGQEAAAGLRRLQRRVRPLQSAGPGPARGAAPRARGDQLLLHYQPKVDLKTNSLIGAEALVRWRHPKRGLVPPNDFIALAEQGGLIKRLTRWVLERGGGAVRRLEARKGTEAARLRQPLRPQPAAGHAAAGRRPRAAGAEEARAGFLELEITRRPR